jgi:hypothetical protein
MIFRSPEYVLSSALVRSPQTAILIGQRVYPVLAPSSATLPLVTWRRAGVQREQTLASPAGMPRVTIEFSIYGTTYEEARLAADAVRSVLDGYGGSANNTDVRQTSLEDESDDFVTLTGSDLPPVYQITQRYDCWWSEE